MTPPIDKELMARKIRRGTASQMWRSRLSWRITSIVFLTMVIVQTAILILSLKQEEQKLLNTLWEKGRIAVSSVIAPVTSTLESPISQRQGNQLMTATPVKGFVVYEPSLNLLGSMGEPVSVPFLKPDHLKTIEAVRRGSSYEVIYRPNDLRKPYIIVARLDASDVNARLLEFTYQSVLIMLLLSGLITTVLMIALGHYLLEPILFLRNNLMKVQENPDNPKLEDSPFNPDDELGKAILISETLIRQNAKNLQQVRSAAEDKIHKLAYYDQLTSLPNRTLFGQKLIELAYSTKTEDTKKLAVVTLDLDHFKDINDSMGHNIGDAILRGVGKRLKASLPNHAVIARAGEDEFAVACLMGDDTTGRDIAEKIAAIIRNEPFKVYNENFQVRCSIGLATFPDDGTDPNIVLKNADIALNRAKEEGRDRIKQYSEDFDRVVQTRFQLLRDLRDALEKKDLTVFYQPQFDLKTGEIIGAEALIRWFKKDNSKEGGAYISPGEFIPIAEQSGLIVPIGEWVMREACETAKQWHIEGKNLRIAVNVSGAQFYQADLVDYTKNVLKDTQIAPHLLELEVTESVFMDDINIAVNTLKQLHELGVELAIDDFGTGYSSLSYLRQFNIDRLKIDQSFIFNALNNPDDAAIAKTIIRLGHSLNLKVIAEGVETKDHEKFLMDEGCDEAQGFRYCRPIPKDQFWDFVMTYNGKLESFDKA